MRTLYSLKEHLQDVKKNEPQKSVLIDADKASFKLSIYTLSKTFQTFSLSAQNAEALIREWINYLHNLFGSLSM